MTFAVNAKQVQENLPIFLGDKSKTINYPRSKGDNPWFKLQTTRTYLKDDYQNKVQSFDNEEANDPNKIVSFNLGTPPYTITRTYNLSALLPIIEEGSEVVLKYKKKSAKDHMYLSRRVSEGTRFVGVYAGSDFTSEHIVDSIRIYGDSSRFFLKFNLNSAKVSANRFDKIAINPATGLPLDSI